MSRALEKTEQAYLDMRDRVLDRYPELALMASCLLVALMASCLLVALMRDNDVYVMNVGDSRAIVAQYEPEEVKCDGPEEGGFSGEGTVEESRAVNDEFYCTAIVH